MNILLRRGRGIMQLGWRLTSLAQLRLQPHAFFERLYAIPWYADTLRNWVRWLQIPAAGRLLEVGCSSGRLATELAEQGHTVFAVDRSARALRTIRRQRQSPRLQCITADALHLPFPTPQFDHSLAASLLNVVADPDTLLTEMRRVTMENGIVACLFPTAAMQQDSARAFIQTQALSGFSTDALLLWAKLATKLDTGDVVAKFRKAGLIDIQSNTFLQGMVAGVRGRV